MGNVFLLLVNLFIYIFLYPIWFVFKTIQSAFELLFNYLEKKRKAKLNLIENQVELDKDVGSYSQYFSKNNNNKFFRKDETI